MVHEFSKPIKITLPIAVNQRNIKGLKLYWLNETNWSWVLIPDAVFTKDKVTFYVNHLTRFAIFADKSSVSANTKVESSIALPQEKKAEYEKNKDVDNVEQVLNQKKSIKNNQGLWLLLILIILLILLARRLNNHNK